MPAAAPTLQADLLALGYTGATVSSVPAPLTVEIETHAILSIQKLSATMSGDNVTLVKSATGQDIPLPGYPYAIPSQRASLQDDLRATHHPGTVVKTLGDEWEILLPNRSTLFNNRELRVTFTPGDPYPYWDMFEVYQGELPDNVVTGQFYNLRSTEGLATMSEAAKNFARLKISTGARYNHLLP